MKSYQQSIIIESLKMDFQPRQAGRQAAHPADLALVSPPLILNLLQQEALLRPLGLRLTTQTPADVGPSAPDEG